MKDYYKILNISNDADFKDVINAYNGLIKHFNNKKLSSEDKIVIKEIKEAYFILGNYNNRRKYDNNREGYKKTENYSDRVFFRPDLNYNYNTDNMIRNRKSDLLNNKKIRLNQKNSTYDRYQDLNFNN